MKYKIGILVAVAGLVIISACGLFEGDPQRVEYQNEGSVCFGGDVWMGDATLVQAGEPLELTVRFPACLSSSCSEAEATSCSIERDGDTLTVVSQGSYLNTSNQSRDCTDDCGALAASCIGPELEEGVYTLVHGDKSYLLNVPGDEEDPGCLED